MAARNFYTSASFQGHTSDLCGVSQSAVHRCIREVTNALYRMAGDYVRYGTDPESQHQRALGFGAIVEFPQVRGVIDCTHVAIKVPGGQPAAYFNRKGFYSLNVQLVCDHRKRFMQVCARFPGSCQDPFILQQSQVPLFFTVLAQIQAWILGDKGYPLQTWLLMPVRNPTSNAEEIQRLPRFNTNCHRAGHRPEMPFCCLNRLGGALQKGLCASLLCAVLCTTLQYRDDERQEQETSFDDEDTEELQQHTFAGACSQCYFCTNGLTGGRLLIRKPFGFG
ncbi:putative nuclease HARBI1 [Heterodontus francisci]|uniref:putative nuclease HARBI1 n=1 Tax=Heterodontus francisci TaxID=7792 RepID=UPI00355B2AB4